MIKQGFGGENRGERDFSIYFQRAFSYILPLGEKLTRWLTNCICVRKKNNTKPSAIIPCLWSSMAEHPIDQDVALAE